MVRRLRGMSIQAMDPCLSSSIHAAGEQASFLSSPKPDTAKRLTATRKGPCSCQPRGSRPKETSALWYVVGGGGGGQNNVHLKSFRGVFVSQAVVKDGEQTKKMCTPEKRVSAENK